VQAGKLGEEEEQQETEEQGEEEQEGEGKDEALLQSDEGSDLAARCKVLIQSLGMTQADAAREIGTSGPQLSQWMSGKKASEKAAGLAAAWMRRKQKPQVLRIVEKPQGGAKGAPPSLGRGRRDGRGGQPLLHSAGLAHGFEKNLRLARNLAAAEKNLAEKNLAEKKLAAAKKLEVEKNLAAARAQAQAQAQARKLREEAEEQEDEEDEALQQSGEGSEAPHPADLAARCKALIRSLKMTQADAAREIGTSGPQLSQWMNGTSKSSVKAVAERAAAWMRRKEKPLLRKKGSEGRVFAAVDAAVAAAARERTAATKGDGGARKGAGWKLGGANRCAARQLGRSAAFVPYCMQQSRLVLRAVCLSRLRGSTALRRSLWPRRPRHGFRATPSLSATRSDGSLERWARSGEKAAPSAFSTTIITAPCILLKICTTNLSSEEGAKLAQKLGQLQPSVAALPRECMG
jgi:transcriptional regulator with XRE-family HTH domain